MRRGGKILGLILNELGKFVAPGITTRDIEKRADELFEKYNVKPSFLGYKGFPSSICTAVNEEVVHGIPGDRVLKNNDIISIDAGVFFEKLHTDSAITVCIGNIAPEVKKFIATGEEALSKAISIAHPSRNLNEISKVIHETLRDNGYAPVKELTGHGVGRLLHEDPFVLNYIDHSAPDIILREGMTLAIEPIYSMGNGEIKTLSDHWTIVTRDNSLAAQIEHTIVITENGCEILTLRN